MTGRRRLISLPALIRAIPGANSVFRGRRREGLVGGQCAPPKTTC